MKSLNKFVENYIKIAYALKKNYDYSYDIEREFACFGVLTVSKKEWLFILSNLTIITENNTYFYEGIFEIIREKDCEK